MYHYVVCYFKIIKINSHQELKVQFLNYTDNNDSDPFVSLSERHVVLVVAQELHIIYSDMDVVQLATVATPITLVELRKWAACVTAFIQPQTHSSSKTLEELFCRWRWLCMQLKVKSQSCIFATGVLNVFLQ